MTRDSAASTWLSRRLLGEFVAGDLGEFEPLGSEQIVAVLEIMGRKRLALAVQADPGVAKALAARLGTHGPRFLAEAKRPAAREQIRAAVHDLMAFESLVRTGMRAIAPWLAAHGDAARVLAQRLPRELGLVLLDEVNSAIPDAEDRLLREAHSELG